jgi:hypothetical protein
MSEQLYFQLRCVTIKIIILCWSRARAWGSLHLHARTVSSPLCMRAAMTEGLAVPTALLYHTTLMSIY